MPTVHEIVKKFRRLLSPAQETSMLPNPEKDKLTSFFTNVFLYNIFQYCTSKPSHFSALTTVSCMHFSSMSCVPTLPTVKSTSLNVPTLCSDQYKHEAVHYILFSSPLWTSSPFGINVSFGTLQSNILSIQ